MGILDRFARSLKANVNSLIDKAEDPAKVIAQTIEDMQDELKKAKQEHVQALASVKQLERKVADHVKESEDWERKAMMALEHGDEELAREALRRKKKSEADAVEADRLRGQQTTYAEDIKASIEAMEKKVEELKAKRSSLAAAVARSRTTPGSDPLNDKAGGGATPRSPASKKCRTKSRISRPRPRPTTCSTTRRRPTSRTAFASSRRARRKISWTTRSPHSKRG
ncbi:MAG: PspA/IM30 family protein [Polyangiales bacterium]